jgi:hypothetical protein
LILSPKWFLYALPRDFELYFLRAYGLILLWLGIDLGAVVLFWWLLEIVSLLSELMYFLLRRLI